MWLYWWKPGSLRHHAHKFGDFRHYGSEDKTSLICCRISQGKVNKGLYIFMSGSFWQYFITLQSLVAIGTMVAKITFSIYCVTSQEQVIKRSCDLMGRSLSWEVTTMTSWVIIGIKIYFLRFKSKVSLARLLPLLLFPHGISWS